MQIDEKTRQFWLKYKEDGDVAELARLTQRERSTISNLLNGKVTGTVTSVAARITAFYVNRRQQHRLMKRVASEVDKD